MYHLQIVTNDFLLQLKTEIVTDTVEGLKILSKQMIKNNPNSIGETYRIWLDGKFVKEGVILGKG